MLRPLDIVSLAVATGFRLRPAAEHLHPFMAWWRQLFHNMKWIDKFPNIHVPSWRTLLGIDTCPIFVIGKDLNRLNYAITKWHYFDANKIRLLMVVHDQHVRVGWDDAIRDLLASIETSYMWGMDKIQVQVRADLVQTCLIFSEFGLVDLCRSWEKVLLERDIGDGVPRLQTFTVWYSKLRMPNFVIDQFTKPAHIVEHLHYSTNDCTVRVHLDGQNPPQASAWVPE